MVVILTTVGMSLVDSYLWGCHISCHFCVHLYNGSRPEELKHLSCFKTKIIEENYQRTFTKRIQEKCPPKVSPLSRLDIRQWSRSWRLFRQLRRAVWTGCSSQTPCCIITIIIIIIIIINAIVIIIIFLSSINNHHHHHHHHLLWRAYAASSIIGGSNL